MPKPQVVSDRVTGREEGFREGLVDDRDFRAAEHVSASEFASSQQRNTHVREMARTNRIAENMLRSAFLGGFAFDVHVGAAIAVVDQRFRGAADGSHAWNRCEPRVQAAEQRFPSRVVVPKNGRRDGELEHVVGAKTQVGVLGVEQALRKGSGGRYEQECERDLTDDESLAQTLMTCAQ